MDVLSRDRAYIWQIGTLKSEVVFLSRDGRNELNRRNNESHFVVALGILLPLTDNGS